MRQTPRPDGGASTLTRAATRPVWGLLERCAPAMALVVVASILCACTGEFPTAPRHLRAAESAFDAQRLVTSLGEIEAWHQANATGVTAGLRPGRSRSSIEAAFAGEGCRPTEELKLLWSWHDGETSSAPFVWYHDFLSLEQARSQYRSLLANPLVPWDPDYIPVFSFEGEWYAAYCGKGASSGGPIVHFFLEDGPRIVFTGLTSLAETMAALLRSGAVRWRDGGMVEDIGHVHRIHQQHNPGYPFPYHVPGGA